MITYSLANTNEDFIGILDLQKKNYKTQLSPAEMKEEGFLSLTHELGELEMITGKYRHIIAKYNERVVGYSLVMLNDFKDVVPVLIPMFDKLEHVNLNGKSLNDFSYFVMGQICIDKDFRSKGIFKGLYQKLREIMSDKFELVITEVATRNLRSMNAHQSVGFKPLSEYVSPENEEWTMVYWDWK